MLFKDISNANNNKLVKKFYVILLKIPKFCS